MLNKLSQVHEFTVGLDYWREHDALEFSVRAWVRIFLNADYDRDMMGRLMGRFIEEQFSGRSRESLYGYFDDKFLNRTTGIIMIGQITASLLHRSGFTGTIEGNFLELYYRYKPEALCTA